jgi:hypothetical protein
MIRIRLTVSGGYVVGDGKCPFDPDEFMQMFMDRVIEAKKAGLDEIVFSEDEVEDARLRWEAEQQFDTAALRLKDDVANAPVHTLPETASKKRILDKMAETLKGALDAVE